MNSSHLVEQFRESCVQYEFEHRFFSTSLYSFLLSVTEIEESQQSQSMFRILCIKKKRDLSETLPRFTPKSCHSPTNAVDEKMRTVLTSSSLTRNCLCQKNLEPLSQENWWALLEREIQG